MAPLYFVLLALLMVVLVPFNIIWVLNTLFSTGIEYSLDTWLATLVLIVDALIIRSVSVALTRG